MLELEYERMIKNAACEEPPVLAHIFGKRASPRCTRCHLQGVWKLHTAIGKENVSNEF